MYSKCPQQKDMGVAVQSAQEGMPEPVRRVPWPSERLKRQRDSLHPVC